MAASGVTEDGWRGRGGMRNVGALPRRRLVLLHANRALKIKDRQDRINGINGININKYQFQYCRFPVL
mgnify:FL=1